MVQKVVFNYKQQRRALKERLVRETSKNLEREGKLEIKLKRNKPKRLTSRDKIEPVDLCQLSSSVDCRSQSIVDLS